MFKYELRQKIFNNQNREEVAPNIISIIFRCIQMAHKTEAPIDNLASVGLKFYSTYFLIDYKVFSSIFLMPVIIIKNQLSQQDCSTFLPTDFPKKGEKISDNWSIHRYGNTIDCQNVLKILHNHQLFYGDSPYNEKIEEEKRHLTYWKHSESSFSVSLLPSKVHNLPKLPATNSNQGPHAFISKGSIYFTIPRQELLPIVGLQTDESWPTTRKK